MIPIKNKKSKSVYIAINKINNLYGDDFKKIFKSITFDNGSEFARFKDIEIKPGTKVYRTKVFLHIHMHHQSVVLMKNVIN